MLPAVGTIVVQTVIHNKQKRNMKKILLLIMTLIVSMTTFAQSDIVSVADAIKIFQTKTLYTGQQVLEKQGYIYKGISTDNYGKDYNWVKNMDLTKNFVPTAFEIGRAHV